ncbi:hypothetical protein QOT17_000570 [Balamuthia mandrillaris]
MEGTRRSYTVGSNSRVQVVHSPSPNNAASPAFGVSSTATPPLAAGGLFGQHQESPGIRHSIATSTFSGGIQSQTIGRRPQPLKAGGGKSISPRGRDDGSGTASAEDKTRFNGTRTAAPARKSVAIMTPSITSHHAPSFSSSTPASPMYFSAATHETRLPTSSSASSQSSNLRRNLHHSSSSASFSSSSSSLHHQTPTEPLKHRIPSIDARDQAEESNNKTAGGLAKGLVEQCTVISQKGNFLVNIMRAEASKPASQQFDAEVLAVLVAEMKKVAAATTQISDLLDGLLQFEGFEAAELIGKEFPEAIKRFIELCKTAIQNKTPTDFTATEGGFEKIKWIISRIISKVDSWRVSYEQEQKEKQRPAALSAVNRMAAEITRDIVELTKAADNKEREVVIQRTKNTLNSLNQLGNYAKDAGLEEEAYTLREAAKEFIAAATVRVENKGDDAAELKVALTKIKKAIESLIEAAKMARTHVQRASFVREKQKGVSKETKQILETRASVVKELFETENTYLVQLRLLLKAFVNPLQELLSNNKKTEDTNVQKYLKHPSVLACLNALPLIADLTDKIRDGILTRMARNDPDLGMIFLELAPSLHIYQEYVNNYGVALVKLEECRKKKCKAYVRLERKFCKESESADITAFLILPIQRPPRYELLLKEVCKNTLEDSESFANLKMALSKITVINNTINLRKKEAENREKIQAIQKSLHFKKQDQRVDLLMAGRLFVREGRLDQVKDKVIGSGHKVEKTFHWFMFNDILVKTVPITGLFSSSGGDGERQRSSFRFKACIPFESCTLEDVPDDEKGGMRHMFTLVPDEVLKETDVKKQKKKRKQLCHRVSCLSEDEKTSWTKEIANAISVNKLMKEVTTESSGGDERERNGSATIFSV